MVFVYCDLSQVLTTYVIEPWKQSRSRNGRQYIVWLRFTSKHYTWLKAKDKLQVADVIALLWGGNYCNAIKFEDYLPNPPPVKKCREAAGAKDPRPHPSPRGPSPEGLSPAYFAPGKVLTSQRCSMRRTATFASSGSQHQNHEGGNDNRQSSRLHQKGGGAQNPRDWDRQTFINDARDWVNAIAQVEEVGLADAWKPWHLRAETFLHYVPREQKGDRADSDGRGAEGGPPTMRPTCPGPSCRAAEPVRMRRLRRLGRRFAEVLRQDRSGHKFGDNLHDRDGASLYRVLGKDRRTQVMHEEAVSLMNQRIAAWARRV